jgi:hypothetical protein
MAPPCGASTGQYLLERLALQMRGAKSNPSHGPLLAIVNCHDIAFKKAAKRFVARMRHGHDASMP